MPGKQAKTILDSKTGKEYPSMYSAGKELGTKLVPSYEGAARLVWFAMVRAFPGRFKVKNPEGAFVELNDPSVPVIKRQRKTETPDQERQRLLARLGELSASAPAAAATATAAPAKAKAKTAAAAPVAEAAEAVEEAEEEVEDEAPVAAPAKKLAGAMKKPVAAVA